MKKLLYLLLATAFLSCNNERVLQLPEIESAEIIEVLDVSPAYIFYDETQPDSTLFNRKNLIAYILFKDAQYFNQIIFRK